MGWNVYKSQWLDMAILFDREMLRFRVKEVPISRWKKNKLVSSGVGAQLSKRLHNAGYSMYQVENSLIHHGDHESRMNYEERKLNPLVSSAAVTADYKYGKKVVCGVAVIESRWDSFKATVESIIDQVDKLYVYQNGFKKIED